MTDVPLNTAAEVREFLALCLDPGPGRDKRTAARVAEIMPGWLAGPLNRHAPHLATLSAAVHEAEAVAAAARTEHTEALGAWIAGDTTTTTAAGAPSPRVATRNSPAPIQSRYLEGFAENASTGAIQGHLDARRADRRGLDRHIKFLAALLDHRAQQIAVGTWPTPTHQQHEGDNR